jgi:hypothetical protein
MAVKRALQARFINFLSGHLFNNITIDDIIQLRPDGVYLQGKKLTMEEIEYFRTEADKLKESFLWKNIMTNRVKYVANRRMFVKGMSDADLVFGKAMLYNLEVLEKLLAALSKLK